MQRELSLAESLPCESDRSFAVLRGCVHACGVNLIITLTERGVRVVAKGHATTHNPAYNTSLGLTSCARPLQLYVKRLAAVLCPTVVDAASCKPSGRSSRCWLGARRQHRLFQFWCFESCRRRGRAGVYPAVQGCGNGAWRFVF